jgi:molybdenum cofactor cytidylyltransferase
VRQIGLIILAAGGSSRLGSPKQLLPFKGRTLLRHAVETALATVCRPVVVVLGSKPEMIEAELTDLPVVIARNPNWTEGMGTSIRTGLRQLISEDPGQVDGVLLMVCDQPFIRCADIDRVCSAFKETGRGIVSSAYSGTFGVPVLFSSKYFSELDALPPGAGARALIARHEADHHSIRLPEAALDVDTAEDYEKALRGG